MHRSATRTPDGYRASEFEAAFHTNGDGPLVSVVIPCLNEAECIERCVTLARETLDANGLDGEVVVCDNGSTDGSEALAAEAGARVTSEVRRGYGSAYIAGFKAARGRYIVMVDADLTYDFGDIPRFVEQLESGAHMVIGDRMDNIQPGAMPWLHRYVGNPFLTGMLNFLFRTGVKDAHCGMRAIRRDVLPQLDVRTTGMEFASEMVIRAAQEELDIRQVPIEYRPGRASRSCRASGTAGAISASCWSTAQRTCSSSPAPRWLSSGPLITLTVLTQMDVFGREWDIHAIIGGGLLMVVGTQVLALGLCAHAYGTYFMGARDAWFDRMRARFRLEHGLLLGGGVLAGGLILGGVVVRPGSTEASEAWPRSGLRWSARRWRWSASRSSSRRSSSRSWDCAGAASTRRAVIALDHDVERPFKRQLVDVASEPARGALPERLSFLAHAQDRLRERLRLGGLGDVAVLTHLDELRRGALRSTRHNARRPSRRGLHDDQAIALAV